MDDDDGDQQATNVIHLSHHHHQMPNPEDECHCGAARCQEIVLSRELDNVLNPRLIFLSPGQLESIWPILTNRQMDPATYLAHLAEYRTERHCGYAWPPNQMAYRCRTCSKLPSMSLCCDCFRAGNHEGHDYNMFKSSIGGACDCGYSVVREEGHCSRHGKNATAKKGNEQVPESMICAPRRALPRLIHRLAIALRRSHVDIGGEIDVYIGSLSRVANSSAVLRGLMIDTLISEQVYSSQIELLSNHPDKDVSKIINEGLKKLKRERKGLIPFKVPENWKSPPIHNINAFCDNLTLTSFLDEFIFWTVLFEFPQKLVCFLLGFLMDDRYKDVFARTFVNYYPRILMILAAIRGEPRRNLRDSYEQLSRRMAQISAQLYNDACLTKTLCEKEHFLHTIIYCLRVALEGSPTYGLRGVLEANPIRLWHSENPGDTPLIVSHDNLIIRDSHLGSFTHDLNSILDFEHGARRLVYDKNLLNTWIEMLSYFQTMNPYRRALNEHTPYETGPQVSLFGIEADFCLSPLWSILNHLKDQSSMPLVRSLLYSIHENLIVWFREMGVAPNSVLDPHHMSFHIPLHRMLAATLHHMLFTQNRSDQEVYSVLSTNQSLFGMKYGSTFFWQPRGPPIEPGAIKTFLRTLLLHPLQTLTICYETRSSMWIRNGLMTAHQAVTYVHSAYCYSTIDLDMFLLRYCASKLNPNYFFRILMSRFHAWKWLSFKSNYLMTNQSNGMPRANNIQPEQRIQMVENSLTVIIQLLTLSIHCNISEREQLKQEMIALISVRDRSYSYLLDYLPNRINSNQFDSDENFKSLLDELTIYKPPQHGTMGNLQQGCYSLKPLAWDEGYDPIHVQYRFNHRRDYQMSLDRYFQHCKHTGKLEKRYHRSALWLPLKIPKSIANFGQLDVSQIIECPTLIGVVFSTIYKTLYISEVPDTIMAYTIHLLELSLRKCLENSVDVKQKLPNSAFIGKYSHLELSSCPAYFGSNVEAYIRGRKIYALFNKQYDSDSMDLENHRLFPVVKHALDLAFDTTWFPFNSILENALVHIENVYLMNSQEFEEFLKCPLDNEEALNDECNQQSSSSGDILLSFYDEGDDEGPDPDDDIVCDEEEYDDIDGRGVGEDESEDSDDEEGDHVNGRIARIRAVLNQQNTSGRNTHYGSSKLTELSRPSITPRSNMWNTAATNIRNANQIPRTQDRATNTQGSWINNSSENQSTGGSSVNTESQSQTSTGNPTIMPHSFPIQSPTSPPSSIQTTTTTTTVASAARATVCDHTYSAVVDSVMEVESLPESQSSALSLLPIHNRNNRVEQSSTIPSSQQLYPENLVTERRAILASDPRPMLTMAVQPLALEAPPGPMLAADSNRSQDQQTTTATPSGSRDERSLSEVDIQTRFMPFFQSRLDSHVPRARICRPSHRQMARRGGHRQGGGAGHPMPPYAVHNPNSVQPLTLRFIPPFVFQPTSNNESRDLNYHWHSNLNSLRRSYDMPVPNYATNTPSPPAPGDQFSIEMEHYRDPTEPRRPRQTARRSNACTLLNRVLLSRTQQRNQQPPKRYGEIIKRTHKDRAHHGESLLSLLLRLHAKYSQRGRSYEFNEERARINAMTGRKRIGDGVHFVTIVLDLICTLDQMARSRLEHLQNLIWGHREVEQEMLHREGMEQGIRPDNVDNKANQLDSMDLSRPSSSISSVAGTSNVRRDRNGIASSPVASMANLDPAERRRRAKELQSKLMAEFANKQRAFIEKYESQSQQQPTAHSKITAARSNDKIELTAASTSGVTKSSSSFVDEEPINLSSKFTQETRPQQQMSDFDELQRQPQPKQQLTLDDESFMARCSTSGSIADTSTARSSGQNPNVNEAVTASVCYMETPDDANDSSESSSYEAPIYECCICGVEGPSDLANPLGQVVLLQSTSVYGHSHLRPQSERRLPCDESQYMKLREETYAKYLERRIDLLCEHFSESSWLDSINIGAEGGVHVQSCGHYLHIECHQSYIKSLDHERPRFRNDSDEFLCPVCRQLANSVLPILSDIRRPGRLSLALVQSENLDDQIKLIGSLLERRLPPNQKELQSSAAFCAHLTKATGPQYRLVRSNASMHSLFLFLTSIARTNLETEVIVRSTQSNRGRAASEINEPIASCSSATTTNNLSASVSKRSCFMLLFHVLALNAQTLINDQWFTCDQIWSHLTHCIDEKNRLSVKPVNSEVPLLLRDPTSMLLQFLFAITNSLCYQANFTCLVQILFNLTAIQSIALVISFIKRPVFPSDQHQAKSAKDEIDPSRGNDDSQCFVEAAASPSGGNFEQLLALVGLNLGPLLAPTTEEPLMNSSVRDSWPRFAKTNGGNYNRTDPATNVNRATITQQNQKPRESSLADDDDDDEKPISFIENRVKLACLPFLRAAAFIQHHLYDQTYPQLEIVCDDQLTDQRAIDTDFSTLTSFLKLEAIKMEYGSSIHENGSNSSAIMRALNWPLSNGHNYHERRHYDPFGRKLIASWSAELLRFGSEFSIAARTLLICRSIAWFRPSLMQLPHSFDDVFMFYYRKECSLCHQEPRDVAICLVCGAPICFRTSCCKDRSRSRLVHSQHCGASTAVFLAVHTSSIVVIRGNRACVWGSVYLDAHGEEDNGLQRGKPLYLVPARFQLLERQWLTHSFEHRYSKPWIYLQENQ